MPRNPLFSEVGESYPSAKDTVSDSGLSDRVNKHLGHRNDSCILLESSNFRTLPKLKWLVIKDNANLKY